MRRDLTCGDGIAAAVIASFDRPPADDGALKSGGFPTQNRIYNVGNNRSKEQMDMIETVEQARSRKAHINMLPMPDGDVVDTRADIQALADDLDYAPPTPISVGLPLFVDWFLVRCRRMAARIDVKRLRKSGAGI